MGEKAKNIQPVVDRDDHHALTSKIATIILRLRARAIEIAATPSDWGSN
jgi:hypothetical protein